MKAFRSLVTIIGALLFLTAAAAIAIYFERKGCYASHDDRTTMDMRFLGSSLLQFHSIAGRLPDEANWDTELTSRGPRVNFQILTRIPMDPWGSKYVYRDVSTRAAVCIRLISPGPDRILGNADDVVYEKSWPQLARR